MSADIRLTCGHCRAAAATHLLVAFVAFGSDYVKRLAELVCLACGRFSTELPEDQKIHTVQLYEVGDFVRADRYSGEG